MTDQYSEAESLYIRALSITEQQLGENHPDTVISLNNLAVFYETQGKLEEAKTFAERALTIYLNTVGEQHPHTLNSLLTVKVLKVTKQLSCDKQTLIAILQAFAEQGQYCSDNENLGMDKQGGQRKQGKQGKKNLGCSPR